MSKSNQLILIIVVVAVVIIGGVLVISKNKTNQTNLSPTEATQQTETSPEVSPTENVQSGQKISSKLLNLLKSEINVCDTFPKEKIEELSGKKIVNAENSVDTTSKYKIYVCYYYQEPPKYNQYNVNVAKRISIGVVRGDTEGMREMNKTLNYKEETDSAIPFRHILVYDAQNKFQKLVIIADSDIDLQVSTFQSNLTDAEALNFVKKFATYLKENY